MKKREEKIRKLKELTEDLNKYAMEYYTFDNPTISDKEYDIKYEELKQLENELEFAFPYSPTQRVGDRILPQFSKYVHKSNLWSLDKAQNMGELKDWHDRNLRIIDKYNASHEEKLPPLKYVLTKKFDGLTINCTYDEEGMLVKSATRGTGSVGEDITAQVKTIKSIPLKIDNDIFFEIRGEAIMTKQSFEEYNKVSSVPLKNLRNGAAGALRNLNVKETAKRNLSAFFYDIGYDEGLNFKNYMEMIDFMKVKGFPVDDYVKCCSTIDEIKKEIDYIEEIRDDLNYDIDGVVIAIDDIATRELLGYTVKFPRWAIAFKFKAQETTTELLDVEWNIGRSGRVTPTAILKPVELVGATIRRATLNNMDDINRKGVKIGSTVFVRRSNDVIPEIMGVADENIKETIEIKPPILCPACGSKIIREGVHYFCENTLSCKPQLVKSIVHFSSREAMDIEGLSEKTAEQLFEQLNIKSIADLYRIKKEDLLTLDRFADKKAQNLIDAIEKSKNCDLSSFIYALGIPNVGKKTATDISKKFKSLKNIQNASFEELVSIEDIGEIVADNIIEFFKQEKIIKSINDLLSLGVNPTFEEEIVIDNPFKEKNIIVTGALEKYSRTEIKNKLNSLGAKVSSSVSKNTDFVIVGKSPGSKYDKALELDIKIITEEEFERMLI